MKAAGPRKKSGGESLRFRVGYSLGRWLAEIRVKNARQVITCLAIFFGCFVISVASAYAEPAWFGLALRVIALMGFGSAVALLIWHGIRN